MSLLNLPNDIVFVIFDELYSPYPLLADPHCRPVCNRRRVYGDLNFYRAWTGPSVSIRTSISTCRNSLNSILDQVSKEFARLRRARVSAVTLTAPHAPIIPYPASTSIHLDLSTENFTSKVDDEKLIEVVGYLPNDFKPRISGLSVVLRASDSAVLYGLCQRLISNIADNIKSLSIRAPECGKDANESCFDWMVLLAPLGESLEHLELHVACLEASDEVLALFSAQVKKLAPALQANLKSLSLTWPITTNWQLDLSDFVNVEALNINYERESEELPASIEAWVNGAKKKPEILEWTLSKSPPRVGLDVDSDKYWTSISVLIWGARDTPFCSHNMKNRWNMLSALGFTPVHAIFNYLITAIHEVDDLVEHVKALIDLCPDVNVEQSDGFTLLDFILSSLEYAGDRAKAAIHMLDRGFEPYGHVRFGIPTLDGAIGSCDRHWDKILNHPAVTSRQRPSNLMPVTFLGSRNATFMMSLPFNKLTHRELNCVMFGSSPLTVMLSFNNTEMSRFLIGQPEVYPKLELVIHQPGLFDRHLLFDPALLSIASRFMVRMGHPMTISSVVNNFIDERTLQWRSKSMLESPVHLDMSILEPFMASIALDYFTDSAMLTLLSLKKSEPIRALVQQIEGLAERFLRFAKSQPRQCFLDCPIILWNMVQCGAIKTYVEFKAFDTVPDQDGPNPFFRKLLRTFIEHLDDLGNSDIGVVIGQGVEEATLHNVQLVSCSMMKTFFIGVARLHRLNNLIINNILLSWLGFLLSNKPDLSTMTPTEVPDFIVASEFGPTVLNLIKNANQN